MGWRQAWIRQLETEDAQGLTYARCEWMAGKLLAMSAPDRIALARELLPPGFVVARDVGERGESRHYGRGWNACRAAMLGEG